MLFSQVRGRVVLFGMDPRPPVPPFTEETARQKVKAGRRGRVEHLRRREGRRRLHVRLGLAQPRTSSSRAARRSFAFLQRKWERELDYRLVKELWSFAGNRISVRFEYESRDGEGQWWRSHGNEQWEFDEHGYMSRRDASINDVQIEESDRRLSG